MRRRYVQSGGVWPEPATIGEMARRINSLVVRRLESQAIALKQRMMAVIRQ